jgi:glycolate oxidase FAD binding subunit
MGAGLEELQRACDGHVSSATDADAVLGVQPSWVASPASTKEVAALMRVAAGHELAVLVRGAGTKVAWGNPPQRCDVVLDTRRLDALVEHAAGDLIVVAGAGRTLEQVQQDVGGSTQRLGVDPPRRGTVGGAVASGSTGPLRLRHGAVRDLVIGMTLVRADGVVAHSGGKVVKNVAGYDLGKLLTGSFGTLGVVTEVAFRLHPVPAGQRWVVADVASAQEAQAAVQALVHSQLMASAVELDWVDGQGQVAAQIEGHADGAAGCAAEARELLGGGAIDEQQPPAWWGREPSGPSALLKVTHEIAALPGLLAAITRSEQASGVRAALRGSPAVGVGLVGLRRGDDDSGDGSRDGSGDGLGDRSGDGSDGVVDAVVRFTESLRREAGTFGGSVVLLEALDGVRERLDPWGPVSGIDLMRAVKAQFDPGRLLAPGRFVGGI